MSDGHLIVECGCGARLRAPESARGKRVRCPACGGTTAVRKPDEGEGGDGGRSKPGAAHTRGALPRGEAASMAALVVVGCACGARLRAPARARGRSVRCPRCAAKVAVPEAPPATDDSLLQLDDEPAARLDDELLYHLAPAPETTPEEAAAAFREKLARPSAPSPTCPSCGRTLAPGAKICVDCGVDVKTGRAPHDAGRQS